MHQCVRTGYIRTQTSTKTDLLVQKTISTNKTSWTLFNLNLKNPPLHYKKIRRKDKRFSDRFFFSCSNVSLRHLFLNHLPGFQPFQNFTQPSFSFPILSFFQQSSQLNSKSISKVNVFGDSSSSWETHISSVLHCGHGRFLMELSLRELARKQLQEN